MEPINHQRQTYLITGAAGFIGSFISRAILKTENAASIIGIDNVDAYYNTKIKERRIRELSQDKRFVFYKTSILDREVVRAIMADHKPTILIHTAAQVGVRNGELHPLSYFSTNVLGTLTVLEEIAPSVHHAIIFSSSSVYGSIRHLPFRESKPIPLSTPISVYGASKAAMELMVHTFYKRTAIPTTIIRPFSIYGPDGRPDMLPIKILLAAKQNSPLEIYAPTKQSRDWTYIDDCVKAVLALLDKPNGIQVVNVGSGHPILLQETIDISQRMIQHYGYTIQYKVEPANPIEIVRTWASTSTLKKIIGRLPTTSYEEGFKKTADFFFSHQDLYA